MVILVRLIFLETLVDLAGLVVRRCVDRVDLHRLVADVRDVVPGACGHEDAPTVGYFLVKGELILCRAHLHATTAAIESQKLVRVGVRFKPDIATHLDRHQGDLQVPAAPGHGPIVLVFECRLFKIERLRLRADVLDGHAGSPGIVEARTSSYVLRQDNQCRRSQLVMRYPSFVGMASAGWAFAAVSTAFRRPRDSYEAWNVLYSRCH